MSDAAHTSRLDFTIDELDEIERIDDIFEAYRRDSGQAPLNVSHWNMSKQFAKDMTEHLVLPHSGDPLNYIYSYELDLREQVLEKLGFNPQKTGCLVTPNGTLSMTCAANWLSFVGARRVTAICPVYFPMLHVARRMGLEVAKRHLARRDGRYELPPEITDGAGDEALWITNPVYGAGVLLSDDDRERLASVANHSPIVLDECLVQSRNEVCPRLDSNPNVIGLYAPHKSLCINAVKFSVVVFDKVHQNHFDQWADVLYGGLTISAISAIKHFLSDNFDQYDRAFRHAIAKSMQFVSEAVKIHCPRAELDRETTGHFVTLYFPWIDAKLGSDEQYIGRMCRQTATVFIPGTRNHFDPILGLCFRINLALCDEQFRASLIRLLRFLASA